jgi:hypothetical protein
MRCGSTAQVSTDDAQPADGDVSVWTGSRINPLNLFQSERGKCGADRYLDGRTEAANVVQTGHWSHTCQPCAQCGRRDSGRPDETGRCPAPPILGFGDGSLDQPREGLLAHASLYW